MCRLAAADGLYARLYTEHKQKRIAAISPGKYQSRNSGARLDMLDIMASCRSADISMAAFQVAM